MSQTPWDAKQEFANFFDHIGASFSSVIIVANSIGAYFAMSAVTEAKIEKAYFISPVVDMEKLVADMMKWAGVTEAELENQKLIETTFSEDGLKLLRFVCF